MNEITLYALEEHFATEELVQAWRRADPGLHEPMMRWAIESELTPALLNIDDERIAAMDDAGIDVAVLSATTPGLQNLPAAEAVALQGPTNDILSAAVDRHPDRFQGFATLATPDPAAAASELRRTIEHLGFTGAMIDARSGEQGVDDSKFWDIYEAAADLRAPIYLHPRAPRRQVYDAYYAAFATPTNDLLATGGIGWHYDAGLVLLRMIMSGLFDRFPQLQVVLGHWGEVVPFYLDRITVLDGVTRLRRPIEEYFRTNVHITPGGISSQRYLRWTTEIVGADRIMYASDYPFNRERSGSARAFLEAADLGEHERRQIASGNWERLLAGIRR